jgi:hypothetical protein
MDVDDIGRLRRSLSVVLELYAKRPAVKPIIERLVDEIEKAEARASADPLTRARALIAAT